MRDALDDLRAFELVDVKDAAVVEHHRPTAGCASDRRFDLIGAGALGGVVWGAHRPHLLSPWLGMAVGGIAGAVAASSPILASTMTLYGTSASRFGPASSALFLLIDNWEAAKVAPVGRL